MTETLNTADHAAIAAVIQRLEDAWNAGDGDAYAAEMATDADFVNIRAEHIQGRAAIAAGHVGIFRSIYAGSANRYRVESARLLGADLALAHVHSTLDAPAGPLAGRHTARFSTVLGRTPDGWQIVAFHNTLAP